MRINTAFNITYHNDGKVVVTDDKGLNLQLDFSPYITQMDLHKKPYVLQHYMALPKSSRTMAFWDSSTALYVPIIVDNTEVFKNLNLVMLTNQRTRPTLMQPECVNAFVGVTLEQLGIKLQ